MDIGEEAGPVVVSASSGSVFLIQSARFERSGASPDTRRSTQLRQPVFKLICGWAPSPLHQPDIIHMMDNTRPSPFWGTLLLPCIIQRQDRLGNEAIFAILPTSTSRLPNINHGISTLRPSPLFRFHLLLPTSPKMKDGVDLCWN